MRNLVAGVVMLLLIPSSVGAWTRPKADDAAPETVLRTRWEGETDLDMLKQVRADLDRATEKDSKIKVVRVSLVSPGGPVITSLEIARLVRDASEKKGLTLEIHAEALCASGCTFVLAAGSPGHRYINRWALFLVHPPQQGGFLGASCISYTDTPKDPEDKVKNAILDLMRDSYMRYTGKPKDTVENWLSCGQERVGPGSLAVEMGLADRTE